MPVTQSGRGSVVGLEHAQVWLVDSDGYAMGDVGEGAPPGTTTHALLLDNPKSAQVPNPARIVTNLTGGNRWRGQVQFGINEIGTFPLVMAELNGYLHALAGGSSQDITTNARWRMFADNLNRGILPQVGLMLTTIWQSREDGSDGVNLYVNYIIPRCQIQPPSGAPMAYQAEGEATYNVSPTFATHQPNGSPLSATGMNLRKDKTVMYVVVTPKPIAITTYVNADTPATTFTLGYLPSGSGVTINDTPNHYAINGTLTALSAVNTTSGAATKAAAGTAADREVLIYETDFEPIPA